MRIGVLCSGGDAPGMNACVRAVVRTACANGHEVVGILRGYTGLLEESFYVNRTGGTSLTPPDVFGWSHLGGAMLLSSRCKAFYEEEGVDRAVESLKRNGFDALIPIGGDGTSRGAVALGKKWDGQIIGCPGTIDNDLLGTDYTIGFSTAVQTAVEAVDKLRDTAASHERMLIVEVMGRHSGYIAAYTTLATGAEAAAIPETDTDFEAIVGYLRQLKSAGRESIIMIVAEGDEKGGAAQIESGLVEANCPYSTRCVILGHLQRGGVPTPEDRRRATQMGYGAVRALLEGKTGLMTGTQNDACVWTPFEDCFAQHRPIPPQVLNLLEEMWRNGPDC